MHPLSTQRTHDIAEKECLSNFYLKMFYHYRYNLVLDKVPIMLLAIGMSSLLEGPEVEELGGGPRLFSFVIKVGICSSECGVTCW